MASKPGSMRCAWRRLFRKSPAPTSRTSDSATWATTRIRRGDQRDREPGPGADESSLSAGSTSARDRLERGHEAAQHARRQREQHREAEHPPVGAHVQLDRDGERWTECHQEIGGPQGDDETRRPRQDREHDALRQVLADEARAARAQGQPNGGLAAAGRRPREQEAGHVDARHEEHEPDHHHEQAEEPQGGAPRVGDDARRGSRERRRRRAASPERPSSSWGRWLLELGGQDSQARLSFSRVVSGCRRPRRKSHRLPRLSRRSADGMAPAIVMGTQRSTESPRIIPMKPRGAIPTTANG